MQLRKICKLSAFLALFVFPNEIIANEKEIPGCAQNFSTLINPHQIKIKFDQMKHIKPKKIQDLTRSAVELLPSLEHPPFRVKEISTSAKVNDLVGSVDLDHEVHLGFTNMVYPVFVHEYGHIAVQASLYRDVPSYALEVDLHRNVDRLAKRYLAFKSKLQNANNLEKSKKIQEEMQALETRWLQAKKELQLKNSHLLYISRYFEEIFSDLLASAVYRKKHDLFDRFDRSGWRDLSIIEKNVSKKMSGDEHHALQKLGAHVFTNYLAKDRADPKVVLQILYEMNRDELSNAVASGWLKPGVWNSRRDASIRKSYFNGREIEGWVEQLILEFDNRIKSKRWQADS